MTNVEYKCMMHNIAKHEANECKDFMKVSHSDTEQIVVEKGGCTRCLRWNHTRPTCFAMQI